jgi:hypothetical protein
MKLLTFLALFLSLNLQSQVTVLNELRHEPILQNRRVELGIVPDSNLMRRVNGFVQKQGSVTKPINPYLEWELDLETVFTHKTSGYVKKRDGFFYLNFERDERKNDWNLTKVNPYPFRIRFAPPKAGEWKAETRLRYRLPNGKDTLVTFETIVLQVRESDRPGNVTVHKNNRNLERDGKVIYPIGQTFPGPYNRTKIWSSHKDSTNKAADVLAWKNFLTDVETYAQKGGRFIKTIETAYGNLIEFEHLGDYTNRLHYAWETDRLMEICEEYDVLVNFNFLYQTVLYTYQGSGERWPFVRDGYFPEKWDYGVYGPEERFNPADDSPPYAYFVRGERPSHMFLNDRLLSYHKQRTRYYVARWGYSPQILAFELLSEPWWLDGIASKGYYPALGDEGEASETAIKALDKYHREISDYIKDSLDNKEHLIMINQFMIEGSWPEKSFVSAADHHNIDLIGGSNYSSRPDKLVIQKTEGNNNQLSEADQTHYKDLKVLFEKYNKPVFYSEAGHYPSVGSIKCVGDKMHRVDVMTLPFTGSSGAIMWTGYRNDEGGHYKKSNGNPDERIVWDATIKAQLFLNDSSYQKVLNGDWTHGSQEEKIKRSDDGTEVKEMQYFVSGNQDQVVGYIKHRGYNYFTQRDPKKCPEPEGDLSQKPLDQLTPFEIKRGQKLFIEGLKRKTRYQVKFYDFDGNIVSVLDAKAKSKGQLKLKSDLELNAELPIVWLCVKVNLRL